MSKWLRRSSSLAGICLLHWTSIAWAQLPSPSFDTLQSPIRGKETGRPSASRATGVEFLRISQEDGQPVSLDVAITQYSTQDKKSTVDLIGAVHIGERSYYTELNNRFDAYDVVLYELVAPEGTVLPKGGRHDSNNPISILQGLAQSALGLESQLARIDYTKKQMVRADLTPQQMMAKMEERGDTPFTVALSAFADVMRQQNRLSAQAASSVQDLSNESIDLFDLLGNPAKLKRIMAQQFVSTGSLDQSLGGTLNQLLVVDRNQAAMEKLGRELEQGTRRIGIFYGAAHMPDFAKRLESELGMRQTRQDWLKAWNLN